MKKTIVALMIFCMSLSFAIIAHASEIKEIKINIDKDYDILSTDGEHIFLGCDWDESSDWMYESYRTIMITDMDGNNPQSVYTGYVNNLSRPTAYKNRLYFTDGESFANTSMCVLDITTGECKKILSDNSIFRPCVMGERLYFNEWSGDIGSVKLYSADLDGENVTKISDSSREGNYIVKNNSLYYIQYPKDLQSSTIMKANLDGSNATIIKEVPYFSSNIDENYAYVTQAFTGAEHYKVSLDTGEMSSYNKNSTWVSYCNGKNYFIYYIKTGNLITDMNITLITADGNRVLADDVNLNDKIIKNIANNSLYVTVMNDSTKTLYEIPLINNDITILLNNSKLDFPQAPYIEDGVTMVPMRAIFEALGAEVEWDSNTRTVTANKNDTSIKLTVDAETAYINNNQCGLTKTPIIKDGSTMVPLRFVSEALGAEVNYNAETKNISINS